MSFRSVPAMSLQACAKLSGNIKDAGRQPWLPSASSDLAGGQALSGAFSEALSIPHLSSFATPDSRELEVILARFCAIYQAQVCPIQSTFPKQGTNPGLDWLFHTKTSACSSTQP